jgi:hypothetical protein
VFFGKSKTCRASERQSQETVGPDQSLVRPF